MKRPRISAIGTTLGLLAAFLLGAFWAFPWDRLAETILEEASRKATAAGFRLDQGTVRTNSRFPPEVEIRELSLANVLGSVRAPSVKVRLKPLVFLTRMATGLKLESQAAQLELPGSRPLALTGIKADLDFSRLEARIRSLSVGGDLGLSGTLTWSFNRRRLSFADLSIRAPESLDPGLNLLRFSIGLRPEGSGQWRLRVP